MAEGDELLQKADALMRRHRAFVAGAEQEPAEDAADADVPVLTEVVEESAVLPGGDADDRAAIRAALARELESWLDEQLPQHVMRVLDGVTDQMIMQLSSKAMGDLLPRLQTIAEDALKAAKPPSAQD